MKHYFLGLIVLFLLGCSTKWTDAIDAGSVPQNQFKETIDIEIQNGLIFLPVSIEGKTYRFLFDTGAPFSISNGLQAEFRFKKVSEGTIVDSDGNRKKVEWVTIPSSNIGRTPFEEQTAFVGDFKANPLLNCLEIDGIIGSNFMRFCDWNIDQEHNKLTLFKNKEASSMTKGETIPFKTDEQFNIFIDLQMGRATLRNVLVDYGSNGSISINKNMFSTLTERSIVEETFVETGYKQSGIVGKPVELKRLIGYTDSIAIGKSHPSKVMLRTGKTVSIGNKFLSRFNVTINWRNKTLHFVEAEKRPDSNKFAGFKLGYSSSKGVYVQSVIEQSIAFQKGIRPLMKVTQLDDLKFETINDFCDYVNHTFEDQISMTILDKAGNEKVFQFNQTLK